MSGFGSIDLSRLVGFEQLSSARSGEIDVRDGEFESRLGAKRAVEPFAIDFRDAELGSRLSAKRGVGEADAAGVCADRMD